MATKIGKAKYGGGKKTYFKLKEGDQTFRILPPLGDLADDGFWSVYYKVHYGYKNPAGKARPFESPLVQDYKTKEIEVPDAAKERLDLLSGKLEEAKKANNKAAKEQLLKLFGGPKSTYNLDSNHYLNAIDLQGNIGILKLRHKAKQALDVVIRKLRDKGVDPLSVENGRYFTFTRTGMGNETQFAVSVYMKDEMIQGVGEVKREVVHVLTDDVIARLGDEAAQLNKLFRKPTSDQVQQIVSESTLATGVSPNIDDILGFKGDGASDTSAEGDAEQEQEQEQPEVIKSATAQTQAKATVAEVVESAPAAAKTVTQLKEEPKAVKAAPVPTTPAAQAVADMDQDAFLKSLGLD